MRKEYKLTDLCCANCAAEIERKIAKEMGILSCSVNFLMQKLVFEIEAGADEAALLKKVGKIVKKVEPDCDMIEIL